MAFLAEHYFSVLEIEDIEELVADYYDEIVEKWDCFVEFVRTLNAVVLFIFVEVTLICHFHFIYRV